MDKSVAADHLFSLAVHLAYTYSHQPDDELILSLFDWLFQTCTESKISH